MTHARGWLALTVTLWALAQVLWLRPEQLASDWNGWRQADTQSIALAFFEHGDGLLYPRVRWGGDGPGYVESELALYPYLTAQLMRVAGPSPQVGVLLSVALVALAALAVGLQLLAAYGAWPALAGVAALLGSQAVAHVATSVQPESACLLLYVLACGAFLRWQNDPTRVRVLALATGLVTLACLIKPTAVQALVAALVCVGGCRRLRAHWRLLAFAAVVTAAVGGLYLLHAHGLYQRYGNTFGLLGGGDRKTPLLSHLGHPGLLVAAAVVFGQWGLGLAGGLALAGLAVTRRLDAWLIGLSVGAAAWAVFSLRYSSNVYYGSHYAVLGAVLAAWAVARAWGQLQPWTGARARLGAVLAVALAVQLTVSYGARRAHARGIESPTVTAGRALATLAAPGSLVLVRSVADGYDNFWQTPNNFEDPTVMYLSSTRGWVVPSSATASAPLDDALRRGARFYADPEPATRAPSLTRWLHSHGRLARRDNGAEIWTLLPPRTVAPR